MRVKCDWFYALSRNVKQTRNIVNGSTMGTFKSFAVARTSATIERETSFKN